MQRGFIQIPRDFFESDYWSQTRTYNECEAILDIISQVRFEASEHIARIGGREVIFGQCQWPASVRFLSARWHWTDRHVRTFLARLKKSGIIETTDTQGVNILTLKKYIVTGNDTQNATPNEMSYNKLVEEVTQRVTQQVTQEPKRRHSGDTKHNNDNNDSSLRSESLARDDEDRFSFDRFWELYDKKVGKGKAMALYAHLSLAEKKAIFEYIPKYKVAQPSKQFRQDPARFLRNNSWEDELIYRNDATISSTNNQSEHPSDSELREQSIRIMQGFRAARDNGEAKVR